MKDRSHIFRDTQVHAAELVELEELGMYMPQSSATASGTVILVDANQHLLDISRRDGGFWHRMSVITDEATGVPILVVYILADAELHVLALNGAEAEVKGFLAGARKCGNLGVAWVSPDGGVRLSPFPFDASMAEMLASKEHVEAPDCFSSISDMGHAVKYALSPDTLLKAGIDPSPLRKHVIHLLATKSILAELHQLMSYRAITKH